MIACKSNLKQLYIGLSSYADSKGAYCSGAFDWKRDGAVTEVGWVADVVNNGILAGKMLCPSNADYINCTYDTLLNETDVSTFSCLSKKSGSPAGTNPDGSAKVNPCRKLLGDYPASSGPMPADEARRAFVEEAIYNRGYNTNYAASWFLVRTAVTLDAHGNLRNSGSSSCAPLSPMERHCTIGPLNRVRADASKVPSNLIPFLGDAAPTGKFLSAQVGNHTAGADVAFVHARANQQIEFGSSVVSGFDDLRRLQWLVGRLESSITRLSAIWHSAQGKLQFGFRRWQRARLSRHQPR